MPNLKARVATLEGPFGRSLLTVILRTSGGTEKDDLAGYAIGAEVIRRRRGESVEALQERAEAAAKLTRGVRVLKEVRAA